MGNGIYSVIMSQGETNTFIASMGGFFLGGVYFFDWHVIVSIDLGDTSACYMQDKSCQNATLVCSYKIYLWLNAT